MNAKNLGMLGHQKVKSQQKGRCIKIIETELLNPDLHAACTSKANRSHA